MRAHSTHTSGAGRAANAWAIATQSSTSGRQARPQARDLIVPSVLAALAVVIPLGLGGAVSPVMLTEQTVLLSGPDGGRAGVRYAAGVVLTTFVIVVAIVLFGRAISLPTKPHLDATLDLVLGLVLVNVAVLVFVLGRRRGGSPSRKGGDDRRRASGSRQARAAFPFGVFSMATNVTTLALIAAAAREISRADAEIAAVAVLVLVLVGLVTMPAWVPLALTRAAPVPASAGSLLCASRSLAAVAWSPSGCSAPPGCSSSDAGSYGCSADNSVSHFPSARPSPRHGSRWNPSIRSRPGDRQRRTPGALRGNGQSEAATSHPQNPPRSGRRTRRSPSTVARIGAAGHITWEPTSFSVSYVGPCKG